MELAPSGSGSVCFMLTPIIQSYAHSQTWDFRPWGSLKKWRSFTRRRGRTCLRLSQLTYNARRRFWPHLLHLPRKWCLRAVLLCPRQEGRSLSTPATATLWTPMILSGPLCWLHPAIRTLTADMCLQSGRPLSSLCGHSVSLTQSALALSLWDKFLISTCIMPMAWCNWRVFLSEIHVCIWSSRIETNILVYHYVWDCTMFCLNICHCESTSLLFENKFCQTYWDTVWKYLWQKAWAVSVLLWLRHTCSLAIPKSLIRCCDKNLQFGFFGSLVIVYFSISNKSQLLDCILPSYLEFICTLYPSWQSECHCKPLLEEWFTR